MVRLADELAADEVPVIPMERRWLPPAYLWRDAHLNPSDHEKLAKRILAQLDARMGALLGADRLRIYADGRIEGAAFVEQRGPRGEPRSPQTVW